EQKNAFKLSGTLHLFEISGLHIAVIAAFLFGCLKRLLMPELLRVLIGLLIVALYVIVTGGAPSAWRAFWMVALFWGCIAVQRQSTPFALLVASAMGVLVWNPLLLWNIGFQLSYMVVAGILLYGLPLAAYLSAAQETFADPALVGRWERAKRFLAQTAAITFSANIASIPLIIIH
ncbi:MAG TPA: ComEC/Rec2 family competence protein, partial [Opitutales bacterium]|nr:ComEC/Rec2 family competence protein [Opitutales bacterium]